MINSVNRIMTGKLEVEEINREVDKFTFVQRIKLFEMIGVAFNVKAAELKTLAERRMRESLDGTFARRIRDFYGPGYTDDERQCMLRCAEKYNFVDCNYDERMQLIAHAIANFDPLL